MNLLKPPKELRNGYKDPKRMADIHNLPCVVCFAKGIPQTTKTIAHHKIGMGLGKKASDLLTAALCENHHTGVDGVHTLPLHRWEDIYYTQDECIELTNRMLKYEK